MNLFGDPDEATGRECRAARRGTSLDTGSTGIAGPHRGYQGESDEWLTPPEIVTQLGPFDLDPCAMIDQPWRTAATEFTFHDDGLAQEWDGRVWLNPPYGQQTGKWLKKLARHGDGIALIFARTETVMFHNWVWDTAAAIFFFRRRLNFHHPNGARALKNAGGPSCLVAYGDYNVKVLTQRMAGQGKLLEL